jgi:hypothetical protein
VNVAAGGSGSASAYGEATGGTGNIFGEGDYVGVGDGGGYANGVAVVFFTEDGIELYIYEVLGTFIPDAPVSPIAP